MPLTRIVDKKYKTITPVIIMSPCAQIIYPHVNECLPTPVLASTDIFMGFD